MDKKSGGWRSNFCRSGFCRWLRVSEIADERIRQWEINDALRDSVPADLRYRRVSPEPGKNWLLQGIEIRHNNEEKVELEEWFATAAEARARGVELWNPDSNYDKYYKIRVTDITTRDVAVDLGGIPIE